MDARLVQQAQSERLAASQAVAMAMTKGASSTTKPSATSSLFKANATGTTGAASSSASSTSASGGATITSSDFLTLLVNELKNQDPTQPTDPNAYITQLVGVNSLEQLISINSGIGTLDSALPPASDTTTSGSTSSGSASGSIAHQVPGTPAL
jgi:flagellar basal-body rod modification protein FlgD